MQVIEYIPNQTARRGRAIRAWFNENVAKQVHHADFLLEPEQLRGLMSSYPQAWVPQKYEPKES